MIIIVIIIHVVVIKKHNENKIKNKGNYHNYTTAWEVTAIWLV